MAIHVQRFSICAFVSLVLIMISVVAVYGSRDYLRFLFSFSSSSTKLSPPIFTDQLQKSVVSFSDRNRAVHFAESAARTRHRSNSIRKKKRMVISREEKLERGLARARLSIRKAVKASTHRKFSAAVSGDDTDHNDKVLTGDIYRNPGVFYQSYREMERRLKVYVYKEGDPPIVHDGPCKNIYSFEGRFIHDMERGSVSGKFRTNDPTQAHLFFMPFSVTWMVEYMYVPNTYDLSPLQRFVSDYIAIISTKYPFWNTTNGSDHFMLACHDWGPYASKGNPALYSNSIRVLCNANSSEGFNPQKDVSLPEIALYGGKIPPKLLNPPPMNASRPHLAFFAGGVHGPIRPRLLHHWKNKDDDMLVFEYLSGTDKDYFALMLQSRFCLCPSGYEVASPRIVEAIYADCVPVILSESYVLPFSDVLRWEAFSIKVETSEIPRLKEILMSVPEYKYRRLQENVRVVKKHFVLNQPGKRFDAFHMILHSIWLRRINQKPRFDI